ncbi:hypothetical protein GYMLUDRAFT_245506 [Collybiopsis luxurians FD-317 M1]|uniref:Uncharacterized protein n=1 Tax=Collybiopsis luxurians FD-317 M1 TaxID=944289 RepID=A0A0D0B6N2_9AGAR|nr:hypothetical protein GYMLUDRAFT_245506 [Collybiopsis luxurians FD-317 M1]
MPYTVYEALSLPRLETLEIYNTLVEGTGAFPSSFAESASQLEEASPFLRVLSIIHNHNLWVSVESVIARFKSQLRNLQTLSYRPSAGDLNSLREILQVCRFSLQSLTLKLFHTPETPFLDSSVSFPCLTHLTLDLSVLHYKRELVNLLGKLHIPVIESIWLYISTAYSYPLHWNPQSWIEVDRCFSALPGNEPTLKGVTIVLGSDEAGHLDREQKLAMISDKIWICFPFSMESGILHVWDRELDDEQWPLAGAQAYQRCIVSFPDM